MKMMCEYPIEYIRWFGAVFVVLATASLIGVLYSMNTRQYKRFGILFTVTFIVCTFFVTGFEINSVAADKNIPGGFPGGITERIPLVVTAGTFITALVVIIILWLRLRRHVRSILTPASLQDGLNKLPDGVYFGTEDDIALLLNRKMQEIMNLLFVNPENVSALADAPDDDRNIRQGSRLLSNDMGRFAMLADGTVWDIHEQSIPMKRGRNVTMVREILAYDITKRYEKNVELEERNRHLNAINEKLREYSLNLDSIIRQKEMLNAKIRLHDDVGRCLLALRTYLSSEDNINRLSLCELWRSTAAVLTNEAERKDDVDRFEVLKNAADAVGVSLIINKRGSLEELNVSGSSQKELEEIMAFAIHECLANTVKHADGDILMVDIGYENDLWSMKITNNGRPPEKEIKETGGLLNLRNMVELRGYYMEIVSYPVFQLTVSKHI